MQKLQCILVGLLLVAACGDENNVKGDSNELFDELCDSAFRCCSRGEVDDLLGPFVDEDNCSDRLAQSAALNSGFVLYSLPLEDFGFVLPNVSLLKDAVEENRARFVGAAVDDCLQFLREVPCNSDAEDEVVQGCVPREVLPDGACDFDLLIEGKVGNGGDCTSSNPSFECKEGLQCIQISSLGTDGVCVEVGEVGDYCYDDSECSEEHFCNVFDGRCELLHTEGQPCEFVDPDDSSPDPRPISQGGDVVIRCEGHLSCDPIFDLCVPDCVQGAPCSSDEQCNQEEGLQCLFVGGLGRCDLQRDVGLPCASDDNCNDDLYCDDNPADPSQRICLSSRANNETCTRNEQCGSDYCRTTIGPSTCQPKVADGGACPGRSSQECVSGYCEVRNVAEIAQANQFPNGFCGTDNDCPGASTCDQTRSRCVELCRARAADGVSCGLNQECLSENCIGRQFLTPGQCQTIPLIDGQICSFNGQCESDFCNPANSTCQTLPLGNGESCFSDAHCDSAVCSGVCVEGLSEGADCSLERCAADFYCNQTLTPRLCVPKRDPGDLCTSSLECHGSCRVLFGRFRCDTTPANNASVCDGL